MTTLTGERVRKMARELGFGPVGIADARPSDHLAFYRGWLAEGRHGEMDYLARPDAVERRVDLRATFPDVRSVVVVAEPYFQPDPEGVPDDPSRGVIARYARGRDYHRVMKRKLTALLGRVREATDGTVEGRAYVDTGPILERDLARRAGLGWFGRNTMLIDPRKGSYFFLGVLLLDLPLEPDPPFEEDRCGRCRACLDACPTGALLGRDADGAPVMDATRCISYLTIEHRGPIPRELRPLIGNRVYGCDICQEVCPFNVKFAEEAAEPGYAARGPGERPVGVEALDGEAAGPLSAESRERVQSSAGLAARGAESAAPLHPGTDAPALVELLRMALSEEGWEAFSRGSAIRRAGRAGFARNVCVGLGNWLAGEEKPLPEAVAVLVEALSDPAPLVRGHAAWALGQIDLPQAMAALEERGAIEPDEWAAGEIRLALGFPMSAG